MRRSVRSRGVWFLGSCLLASLAMASAAEIPPAPSKDPDAGADRSEWLEPADSPTAVEWAAKRSSAALDALLAGPDAKALVEEIRTYGKTSATPPPFVQPYSILGARLARVIINSEHSAGIIQTAPRGPEGASGPWRTLLDVDALNAAEHEQYGLPVLNLSTACLPPEYRRCMITLGLRGSEIQRIREFDLETGKFIEQGFKFLDAKTEFTWLDADTLLVGQAVPGDSLKSGFPSTVRIWRRGTPYSEAKPIFQANVGDFMFRITGVGLGEQRKGLISVARGGVYRYETLVAGKDGTVVPTHLPTQIPYPGNVGLTGGTSRYVAAFVVDPSTINGKFFPAGTVVAYDTSDATPADRRIGVVYVPPPGTYIYDAQFGATYSRSDIYLVVTRNLRRSLLVASPSASGWKVKSVFTAGPGENLTVWGGGLAADTIALGVQGYLRPLSTSLVTKDHCCVPIGSIPPTFDASQLVVEIHTAKSRDGALVDYYLVRPRDSKPGPVPTILGAYGGGGGVIGPAYAGSLLDGGLISWLTRGGAYAFAGIRGGGEKGGKWWHDGSGRNKINGAYDVAAVADDLIKSGFTTPAKLGFTGRSYGGLMAAAVAMKFPELFGAVLIGVPVVDTYPVKGGTPQLSAVDSDLGDPHDPGDLAAMLQFMPFQNVRAGVKYPAILTVASTSDDRVGPGPARRLTAKLEAVGATPLLIEGATGGHLFPKASVNPEAVAAEVMFFIDNLMR
jgi:prolyl oligopeptidase